MGGATRLRERCSRLNHLAGAPRPARRRGLFRFLARVGPGARPPHAGRPVAADLRFSSASRASQRVATLSHFGEPSEAQRARRPRASRSETRHISRAAILRSGRNLADAGTRAERRGWDLNPRDACAPSGFRDYRELFDLQGFPNLCATPREVITALWRRSSVRRSGPPDQESAVERKGRRRESCSCWDKVSPERDDTAEGKSSWVEL